MFVIGAMGNGMQIYLLSVSTIIDSFTVNEKGKKGLTSVIEDNIKMWGCHCFV